MSKESVEGRLLNDKLSSEVIVLVVPTGRFQTCLFSYSERALLQGLLYPLLGIRWGFAQNGHGFYRFTMSSTSPAL